MGQVEDNNFANIVNLIEQLKSPLAGADRTMIEAQLGPLVKTMTNEQLQAYIEFAGERAREAQQGVNDIRTNLAEADAELKRRKG